MKPKAQPQRQAPEPHPTCTVCDDDAPCLFHSAQDAEELAAALQASIRERGALGLLASLEASMATLTAWEDNPLAPFVATLPVKPVQNVFFRLLDAESLNGDDLVKLAAAALTLRIITETKENHGPQPTRR